MRYIKIILLLLISNSLFGQTDLLPGGVKGRDGGSDSTFLKTNNTVIGKRPTDNIYKNGTLGIRTTDTSGVLSIYTPQPVSTDKPKINLKGDGHILMKIDRDTGTTIGTDFYMTRILGSSGAGGGNNNQVWMAGWNVSAGGGLVDPTQPSCSYRIEERYRNSTGEAFSYEVHLPDIRFTNGDGVRPLTGFFSRDHADKRGNWQFASDFIDFSDYSNTQKAFWGFKTNGVRPKGITFLDTAQLVFYANNTSVLQQRNAANTRFWQLLKLNANDKVELSPEGAGLYTSATNFAFLNGMTLQPNNGQGVAIGSSGNAAGQLEVFSSFPLWMKNSTNTSGFSYVLNGSLELRDMSTNDAIISIENNAPANVQYIRSGGALGIGNVPDSDVWLHVKKTALGASAKLFGIENSTGKSVIYRSSATPENAITANQGDITLVNDGTNGFLFGKYSATNNTGWGKFLNLIDPNGASSNQVLTWNGTTWTPATNTSESTTIGAFQSSGNSNGLTLSGTDIRLHAATISTPGGVNVGQQTFGVGSGTKIFNGTGSKQLDVDGNTDATAAGIGFTQLGTDVIGYMAYNSADANHSFLRVQVEEGGSMTDYVTVGALNDTKGVQERGGLYEEVTNVTSSPYNVVYGDRNIYLDGTSITVNLQAIGGSTNETKIGRVIYFFNDNATDVTLTPNGFETINDSASLTLPANTGVTLLAVTGTKWVTRD